MKKIIYTLALLLPLTFAYNANAGDCNEVELQKKEAELEKDFGKLFQKIIDTQSLQQKSKDSLIKQALESKELAQKQTKEKRELCAKHAKERINIEYNLKNKDHIKIIKEIDDFD